MSSIYGLFVAAGLAPVIAAAALAQAAPGAIVPLQCPHQHLAEPNA